MNSKPALVQHSAYNDVDRILNFLQSRKASYEVFLWICKNVIRKPSSRTRRTLSEYAEGAMINLGRSNASMGGGS